MFHTSCCSVGKGTLLYVACMPGLWIISLTFLVGKEWERNSAGQFSLLVSQIRYSSQKIAQQFHLTGSDDGLWKIHTIIYYRSIPISDKNQLRSLRLEGSNQQAITGHRQENLPQLENLQLRRCQRSINRIQEGAIILSTAHRNIWSPWTTHIKKNS